MVERYKEIKSTRKTLCDDCSSIDSCKESLKENRIILHDTKTQNCITLNTRKDVEEFKKEAKKE